MSNPLKSTVHDLRECLAIIMHASVRRLSTGFKLVIFLILLEGSKGQCVGEPGTACSGYGGRCSVGASFDTCTSLARSCESLGCSSSIDYDGGCFQFQCDGTIGCETSYSSCSGFLTLDACERIQGCSWLSSLVAPVAVPRAPSFSPLVRTPLPVLSPTERPLAPIQVSPPVRIPLPVVAPTERPSAPIRVPPPVRTPLPELAPIERQFSMDVSSSPPNNSNNDDDQEIANRPMVNLFNGKGKGRMYHSNNSGKGMGMKYSDDKYSGKGKGGTNKMFDIGKHAMQQQQQHPRIGGWNPTGWNERRRMHQGTL